MLMILVVTGSYFYIQHREEVSRGNVAAEKMKMMADGVMVVSEFTFEPYGLENKNWNDDETKVAARVTVNGLEALESGVDLLLKNGKSQNLSGGMVNAAEYFIENWVKQGLNEQTAGCIAASYAMQNLVETLDIKKYLKIYKRNREICREVYM